MKSSDPNESADPDKPNEPDGPNHLDKFEEPNGPTTWTSPTT